jgi:hypothetical protein
VRFLQSVGPPSAGGAAGAAVELNVSSISGAAVSNPAPLCGAVVCWCDRVLGTAPLASVGERGPANDKLRALPSASPRLFSWVRG